MSSTVQLNGAEWKAFYNDKDVWVEGAWYDDVTIYVNDILVDDDFDTSLVADSDKIRVETGSFYKDSNSEGQDLLSVIRKWKRVQTRSFVVFEVPKGREEEAKAALKAFFAKDGEGDRENAPARQRARGG